jgi:hypothetical protein
MRQTSGEAKHSLKRVLIVVLAAIGVVFALKGHAQSEETPGHARWDYLAISDVSEVGRGNPPALKFSGVAELCYFGEAGCRKVKIEGGDKAAALSKVVSQLGNEGWEMVGDGPFPVGSVEVKSALFFKRRKS